MNELWNIKWYDRQGRAQDLTFELGRGLRYRVVVPEEQDKNQFLRLLLRPPQSALLSSDGGLLGNLKIDENLLLPLGYRGANTVLLESRVTALFERCGFDRMQTSQLLSRLPHQMSPYQKRVVGFVRSILMQPKVMVYDSIWHRVSQAEKLQLIGFDEILRNESPSCTGVFVDYDTNMEAVLQVQQSFYL